MFNGGFSYHAVQAKFEKRYSMGLYFINSFTWSEAIDTAPGHLENIHVGVSAAPDSVGVELYF